MNLLEQLQSENSKFSSMLALSVVALVVSVVSLGVGLFNALR